MLDDNGETLDQGYHDWRGGGSFDEKDGILQLTYGYGGPLCDVRYYDTTRGRVSPFFSMPLATHGETVAYFSMGGEEILLVVQNMFDPATYYKEFDRDFSVSCVLGDCKPEFLQDGQQLKLTYWQLPNDEVVTEIFDL